MTIPDKIAAATRQCTDYQYHADAAISYSRLALAGEYSETEERWTPHRFISPTRVESSAAMNVGTLTHLAVYQPQAYAQAYAVRPEKNGRLVASNTAEFATWKLNNEGKIIVSSDEIALVESMHQSVMSSEAYTGYSQRNPSFAVEIPLWATCPDTGLDLRIKPDMLRMSSRGHLICEDLKTTADGSSPYELRYAMRKMDYWRRCAFYSYVLQLITGEVPTMVIVSVSKEPPHECIVAPLVSDELSSAHDKNMDALRRIAAHYESDDWRPTWMRKEINL